MGGALRCGSGQPWPSVPLLRLRLGQLRRSADCGADWRHIRSEHRGQDGPGWLHGISRNAGAHRADLPHASPGQSGERCRHRESRVELAGRVSRVRCGRDCGRGRRPSRNRPGARRAGGRSGRRYPDRLPARGVGRDLADAANRSHRLQLGNRVWHGGTVDD